MNNVEFNKKVAHKYLALENSARTRGLQFNLTLTSVRNLLLAKKCYYTGKEFSDEDPDARSVDRIDNTKGYIIGNVAACTTRFNGLKGRLTPKQIEILYNKVCKR